MVESTPRRLAVIVLGVDCAQSSVEEKIRGPPAKVLLKSVCIGSKGVGRFALAECVHIDNSGCTMLMETMRALGKRAMCAECLFLGCICNPGPCLFDTSAYQHA